MQSNCVSTASKPKRLNGRPKINLAVERAAGIRLDGQAAAGVIHRDELKQVVGVPAAATFVVAAALQITIPTVLLVG